MSSGRRCRPYVELLPSVFFILEPPTHSYRDWCFLLGGGVEGQGLRWDMEGRAKSEEFEFWSW
eukprot:2727063-Alexandrium_andersonii.AAC.1